MRKIGKAAIALFLALLALIVALAIATSTALFAPIVFGSFRPILIVVGAIVAGYLYAFVIYRAVLFGVPLEHGPVPERSRAEFGANLYFLFYLVLFNPLIRTHFLPAPLLRLVYLALGARLGDNTYSAGAILDPPLTVIGDNCIIGHDAVLFAHVIEGRSLAFFPIRIGNNVTVGATAVVLPDVIIGDDAVVAAGAVVQKGTRIEPGEKWGGVPARKIGARSSSEGS